MPTPSVKDIRGEIVHLIIMVEDIDEELTRSILSETFDYVLQGHGNIVAVGHCLLLATFGFPYKDVAEPMKTAGEMAAKLHQQFGAHTKILYGGATGRFANVGSKFPRLVPIASGFSKHLKRLTSMQYGEVAQFE